MPRRSGRCARRGTGPPSSASASTAARPRASAQASSSSRKASTSSTGVRPKSIAPPTSFQASIWRRMSPDAIACPRARSSATSCAPLSPAASSASAHQLPRIREVSVAADRLEDRDRPSRDAAQGVGVGRRAHEGHARALDLGSELGRLVAVARRMVDRLGESRVGGVERSGAAKRPAEVGEQPGALGGLDREQPACPLEERLPPPRTRRDRARVVLLVRAVDLLSERRRALRRRRDRALPVEVRLLEVVADDLLLPGQLRAGVAPRARTRAARGDRRGAPSASMRTRRRGSARG